MTRTNMPLTLGPDDEHLIIRFVLRRYGESMVIVVPGGLREVRGLFLGPQVGRLGVSSEEGVHQVFGLVAAHGADLFGTRFAADRNISVEVVLHAPSAQDRCEPDIRTELTGCAQYLVGELIAHGDEPAWSVGQSPTGICPTEVGEGDQAAARVTVALESLLFPDFDTHGIAPVRFDR